MAFEPGEIEVSIDLTFSAGLHIKVDKAEWEKMSHDERKAFVDGYVELAQIRFNGDVTDLGMGAGATVSHEIIGPMESEITPEAISIYDPAA